MRCRFLYQLEFFWKVFFWTYFLCSISKWSDPGRFPFPQSKGVPVNVLTSVGVFFETFFKMPVKISQYCGTVGLLNSRSIVNRSKVNSFVTSKYKNNTYIACSLVFVNKIFLFWHCSASYSFSRIMYQKTTSSSLFRFYFPPPFYQFHLSFFSVF